MTALFPTEAEQAAQHIAAIREWAAARDLVFEGDAWAWAVFTPDRTRRLLLGRAWDLDAPTAHWTMINPSKAGAHENDPTIWKVVGFSRRRAGGVIVSNLTSLISTDPRGLVGRHDLIGPHDEDALRVGSPFGYRVLAWGAFPSRKVRDALHRQWAAALSGGQRWCYGKTKDGEPRHPLMLAYATPLVSMGDGRAFP